jgi:hypothetical protein
MLQDKQTRCERNSCWLRQQSNKTCRTCEKEVAMKNLTNILQSPYTREGIADLLELSKGPVAEKVLNHIYRNDKTYLKTLLTQSEEIRKEFFQRMAFHSDTELCSVVCWCLHQKIIGLLPYPAECMLCLANMLRYYEDKYASAVILRSVLYDYNEGIRMNKLIRKGKHLEQFAWAIMEVQGMEGVYLTFLEKSNNPPIHYHPILDAYTLRQNDEELTNKVYSEFRRRKARWESELMEKAMHPSRVFHWCFTEDEKNRHPFTPMYVFSEGRAEWFQPLNQHFV